MLPVQYIKAWGFIAVACEILNVQKHLRACIPDHSADQQSGETSQYCQYILGDGVVSDTDERQQQP